MITRKGRIKRVEVGAFESVRSSGLIAVNLDEDDELGWVKMTAGKQDLILVSRNGQAIRFSEEEVRAMGRTAAGVYAIRLDDDDVLTGADVVWPDHDLLLITEKGYGKRTSLDEFRQQSRYGKGVRAMDLSGLTGRLVSSRVVSKEDEVTCISSNGIILRTAVTTISRQGRYSRGVSVMDLKGSDIIASVAIVREGHLSRVNELRPENGQPQEAEEEPAVQPEFAGQ
jgi:DNA gyrase subunit A